jgi:hypothetical protein
MEPGPGRIYPGIGLLRRCKSGFAVYVEPYGGGWAENGWYLKDCYHTLADIFCVRTMHPGETALGLWMAREPEYLYFAIPGSMIGKVFVDRHTAAVLSGTLVPLLNRHLQPRYKLSLFPHGLPWARP